MQDPQPPTPPDEKTGTPRRPYAEPTVTDYGTVTSLTAGSGSKKRDALAGKQAT